MHLATTRLSARVFLFPYSLRVYLIYNICLQLLLLTSQTQCWCYWSSLHKTVCNSVLSSTFWPFRHYINTLSHTLTLSPSSTDFLLFLLLLSLHISSFLLPFMSLHPFIFRQYRCLFCGTSGRQQALCQIIAQYSPGGFAVQLKALRHPCLLCLYGWRLSGLVFVCAGIYCSERKVKMHRQYNMKFDSLEAVSLVLEVF